MCATHAATLARTLILAPLVPLSKHASTFIVCTGRSQHTSLCTDQTVGLVQEDPESSTEPPVEDVTSPSYSEIAGVQTAASVWLPSSQAAQHMNKARL